MTPIDVDQLVQAVPSDLRERPQWVCWRYVERDGKSTKCPIDPVHGGTASSTDRATWGTFEQAVAALHRCPDLEGIGFVFTDSDPFAGVDLDDCVVDGQCTSEAQSILDSLGSYSEISPSGTGVKIFLRGKKPAHAGCRSDAVEGFDHIEIYDDKRYFTVTGAHVPGTPPTIEERQEEFLELCHRFWPLPLVKQSLNGTAPRTSSGLQLEMGVREARCRNYLSKCPEAVSGHGGHNATLRAACECHRFGLDKAAAWRLMQNFNEQKTAGERWSDKELQHKLDSARVKVEAAGEMGARLIEIPRDVSAMAPGQIGALMTDVGNAARLGERFGDRIRFSYGPQQWLLWDGRRWKTDERGTIVKYCKQTALSILNEAKRVIGETQSRMLAWATTSQRRERLTAMAALAQPELGVGPDQLDADPWLLNCLNGTIDLRTAVLRPHDPGDLITKLAPVEFDPNAKCPRFDQFLTEIFGEDVSMIDFIQRVHGYALTGDVREQYLFIYFGEGNNGKNVLLDTISEAMGDYGCEAPPDLLTVRKYPEHPTEIADLLGIRLAIASETEREAELRLQLIKRLTGNARLKARRMRQDFFEFPRTHKLIMVTNNRPVVREDTEATWRRLRIVPFNFIIPPKDRDPLLSERLRAELPGILAWMVRGCVDWLRGGLTEPPAVIAATAAYRNEANTFEDFLRECCTLEGGAMVLTGDFHVAYTNWCASRRCIPLGAKALSTALQKRDCLPGKDRGRRCWVGLRLQIEPIGHDGHHGH